MNALGKIHILFKFQDGPWGGGNQFLKALRGELKRKGLYSERPENADLILFNSHHDLSSVLWLKLKYPEKIFVHRIDGPIFFIRDKNLEIDKIIFKFSEKIADLSIFQSNWSLKKCIELGYTGEKHATIYNAPNNSIFNTVNKKKFDTSNKIRLIATSWSGNKNKGFDVYQYIDAHLDFSKYSFTFVGNIPSNFKFKNIKYLKPLPTKELAVQLKDSDIFITASKNDPCSNSLIEALSCGLPSVGFNGGGHPELIQKGGETFNDVQDAIQKIEKIATHYATYQHNIPDYNIRKVANDYLANFNFITNNSKKRSFFLLLSLYIQIKLTKLISILK
jgi:glycosyltransferase involved in cell wall biosynthesis